MAGPSYFCFQFVATALVLDCHYVAFVNGGVGNPLLEMFDFLDVTAAGSSLLQTTVIFQPPLYTGLLLLSNDFHGFEQL